MIFLDFETTGLLKPSANKFSLQPKAIEFYGIKLNDDFEFVDEFETFINPGMEIPEFITKITNINDSHVEFAPTFPEIYERMCEFFLGEKTVVAHNVSFDMGIMYVELARMEKECKFPWPSEWICTVEKTMHLKSRRMKLSELHEEMTGTPHREGAHRAKADVHALVRAYIAAYQKGIL